MRVNWWVNEHDITKALIIEHDQAVDEVILYAMERKWLTIDSPPSTRTTRPSHSLAFIHTFNLEGTFKLIFRVTIVV